MILSRLRVFLNVNNSIFLVNPYTRELTFERVLLYGEKWSIHHVEIMAAYFVGSTAFEREA